MSSTYYRLSACVAVALISCLVSPGHVRAGLVAQWEFDDPSNIGKATVGSDLVPDSANVYYTSAGKFGGALDDNGSGAGIEQLPWSAGRRTYRQ